jgi:UDP-3-O-[3-hydroxymyristoyl] glucosamine N-acyltransferase
MNPYGGWDSSVTIGTTPFSYDRSDPDRPVLKKAKGGTSIGDHVDIMSHANVDRGLERDTVVGDHTKLDHGVQIGHDCQLGKANIVCAGARVGAYTVTGDRVYIGMGALIKPRLTIGDDAVIGMGAVVKRNVPAGEVWDGNPACFVMTRQVFDGLKGNR